MFMWSLRQRALLDAKPHTSKRGEQYKSLPGALQSNSLCTALYSTEESVLLPYHA